MKPLTNIQTLLQFTQYGDVKRIVYNGNKLRAMNSIKLAYGVKSFSIINEYKVAYFLPEGSHTFVS